MDLEMRQKLAQETYAEKIRKVAQLIRLAKTFPRRQPLSAVATVCDLGRGFQPDADLLIKTNIRRS